MTSKPGPLKYSDSGRVGPEVILEVTASAPTICVGPRKVLLSESTDDVLKTSHLKCSIHATTALLVLLMFSTAHPEDPDGSYDALNLDLIWMTADDYFIFER